MNRLHPLTRIILLLAVLSMAVGYFTPLWQIQLWAPQYPEGLNMKIWIDRLSGAFDIINGLNHYIGMALIKVEMFPEFGYMKYLLGALIAVGVLAAIGGTRKWLWIYVIILGLGGLAGMADYYRWGYEYGHNLDPGAAIQVPGMTYQPPLIGYKNLLNFTAYSGPDIGGWVLIVSGVVAGMLLAWEQFWRHRKKGRGSLGTVHAALLCAAAASLLSSCDAGPEPMRYGQDECSGCKMIISDRRFGAEIITRKGRVLKFDDITCLHDYLADGELPASEVKLQVVCDFNHPNTFIPIQDALFLTHQKLDSPMGGDSAAFATQAELQEVKTQIGAGQENRWPAVVSSN